MKKLKTTMFSCAALLLVFLTSCAPQVEELDNLAGPQAQEVQSTYTFHALIPGTLDHVSQMDLIVYADGTSEANRSVIPFDPDLNFSDYQLVGASETIEMGNELQVHFTEKTWFIPFNLEIEPSPFLQTEGHISVSCWCSMSGNCNAKTTVGPDKSITVECVSNGCNGNCNADVTHATNSPVSIPGVLVTASQVTAN